MNYLDVQMDISCLMILFSIFTQFFVILGPDSGQVGVETGRRFNKHIHKSVLVVIGDFLDLCD